MRRKRPRITDADRKRRDDIIRELCRTGKARGNRWQTMELANHILTEEIAKRPPEPPKKKRNRHGRFKKKNYRKYLESPEWKAKRLEALNHYGRKCSICGAKQRLRVHHKTYGSLGNEPMKHLAVLCEDCHAVEHEGKPAVTPDRLTQEYRAIIG